VKENLIISLVRSVILFTIDNSQNTQKENETFYKNAKAAENFNGFCCTYDD